MQIVSRNNLTVLVFCLLVGLTLPVNAQTPQPNPPAKTEQGAEQSSAGKFIQDLGNKAVAILADKNLTPEQRSSKYSELLHAAFDLPTIGHFVLGRAWNTATPQQQQEYMKLFESVVVKIYGDRLNFYSGESFRVKNVRQEDEKNFVVSSEINHPGGAQSTPVDWRVRPKDGTLTVVDVSIEGVSQSVTQRDEYAAILQRNNGNIDALLNLMRERVQKPAEPSGSPSSPGPSSSGR